MTDISGELRRYLDEAADRDMVWGVDDCSSWAAKWVERICGRPIERATFASREEAMRLIARAGSLDTLWDGALLAYGLRQAWPSEAGDVGLIEISKGIVGGIFLHGGLFALRAEPRGYAILQPRKIIRIWSIQ